MADYRPFKTQRAAHKAFLVDDHKLGLLYWSRRCFTADALVMTASGVEVPIVDVRPGMWVVSHNGQEAQPKEVLELHRYGIDQDPKPMIQFKVNGRTITSTYDHEYFTDAGWYSICRLLWGKMDALQKEQLRLLCQQYGKDLEQLHQGTNEAGARRFWIFKDRNVRQDSQSPPGSGPDLDTEPLKQTPDQSYKQQANRQSDRKLGVGNSEGEPSTHDGSGKTKPERWRKMRDSYPDGEASARNLEVPNDATPNVQVGNVQDFGREISSLFGVNTPYFEGQDLEISEIKVLPATITYDLTVADNHNYVVHGLSVHNTGKTLWSIQQLMWSAMLNQGPHYIVFKEYQQAETVAWGQYLHLIPKELIRTVDKSLLTVYFNYFDGKIQFPWCKSDCDPSKDIHTKDCDCVLLTPDRDKPASSLRFLGSDKADQHRGNEAIGMIFDEYQDQDPEPWFSVYSKFFATTSTKLGSGWACFMGTAKDKDYWNEMIDRSQLDERWYFSKATYRDNPLVTPQWVENDRKQHEDAGMMGIWLQEMELVPFTQQGAVYPMFDKKIHVIKPQEVPDEGTDYIALDFGFAEGHPMAACFIRITREDVWYQWDEIHDTGILIDDLCAEIRTKMGDRNLTGIVADSARPDLIEYMQSKGFPVIPSPKKQNSITSGIQLLAKRLRPKIQIMGEPKPNYFISDVCKKTIYDFTHYRYKEFKKDRHPSELPEKRYDDSLDAIRYLELFFKFGIQKDDKPIKSSVVKELNGYGLL